MSDHEAAVRRGIAVLDAAADRKEPMRFLRHREVEAWRLRQATAALMQGYLDMVLPLPSRLPTAQQYRGGPLVV